MWTPISELDVHAIVRVAARRGLVRMRNGRIAQLVSWPTPRDRIQGQSARMETRAGTRFRLNIREVEAVDIEEDER